MMNATIKLGVLCRINAANLFLHNLTHIKFQRVKEQNSLCSSRSHILMPTYPGYLCCSSSPNPQSRLFSLEICFPSVIQPIILGLNIRGLGNVIKSYRGYDPHIISIGAKLNIFKQCAFIHVGSKNIIVGCRI